MKKPEEVLGGKKPKHKKKHYKETRIEHHHDGSHTVRHVPADGGDEVSYASPDMAGVHAGLDSNVGAPPPEEASAGGPPAGGPPAGGPPAGGPPAA